MMRTTRPPLCESADESGPSHTDRAKNLPTTALSRCEQAVAHPPLLRAVHAGVCALGRRQGLPHSSEYVSEGDLSLSRLATLLDMESQTLEEPHLGLRLAQVLPIGSFGFFDYCVMSSATLREGIQRAARLYDLLTDGVALTLCHTKTESRIVLRVRHNTPRIPVLMEFTMAVLARRCREAVGDDMAFQQVHIAGVAAADGVPYADHFGAPVSWDGPLDQLLFDSALLECAFRTCDRETSRALFTHAEGLHPDIRASEPFLDDVRAVLRDSLRRRIAGVRTTAVRLGLSTRTLQRRLAEAGVTYSDVVDGVRRESALQWVAHRSPSEVAELLGFSTPTSFFRAFHRWTGMTPRAYSRKLMR